MVGSPRSGTTLLRLMLDAHPLLAIPPETGFVPAAAALPREGEPARTSLLALIHGFETWPDFHIPADALAARFAAIPSFTVPEGLRAFYALYAARFSKPRWGDKTPDHGRHIPTIRELLPEARFIHLIRDGRDVALSLRPLWFAPGRDMTTLARSWAERVRTARAGAAGHPAYLEVRYEELVASPEAVLRRIAAFLDLEFDSAMLAHHRRAGARLDEHEARTHPDGRTWLTWEQRQAQLWRARHPLDPDRAGRWRLEMSAAERAEFEAAAGDLLDELGYARD
ncbi:MAG TPA: sulfotransferase [Vicinamibacteria bacterium]|nr:sulfotransferase [Vicinamibacteria bacterium]